jgi:hypothetical protein
MVLVDAVDEDQQVVLAVSHIGFVRARLVGDFRQRESPSISR